MGVVAEADFMRVTLRNLERKSGDGLWCGAGIPGAKRLECLELAPAFGAASFNDSASELDALQTLRVTEMPLFPYVSAFKAAQT